VRAGRRGPRGATARGGSREAKEIRDSTGFRGIREILGREDFRERKAISGCKEEWVPKDFKAIKVLMGRKDFVDRKENKDPEDFRETKVRKVI